MVKYAQVTPGSVVQLGRFNGDRRIHSGKTGFVVRKMTTKIGKNVYSAIVVETGEQEQIEVQLHNIREILA